MNKLLNLNKLIYELNKHNLSSYDIFNIEDFNKLQLQDILSMAESFNIDINNYLIATII